MVAVPIFLIVLFFPGHAWAWGPGAHVTFAMEVLNSLSSFAPFLQDLLRSFPNDYLYGNISADIILGRRFAEYRHHCHNWAVGFQVLEDAGTRAQRAFAYGYLSHLAADTIAHNYFVPYQILTAYSNRVFRHNYWEMRFDALAEEWVWEIAGNIRHHVDKGDDPLLEKTLKRVMFSFMTNKRIFSSILIVQRMKQWRRMVLAHSSASRWKLTPDDFLKFSRLAYDAIESVLKESSRSRFVRLDPTGGGALTTAKTISGVLRMLARKDGVSPSLLARILSGVKPEFLG